MNCNSNFLLIAFVLLSVATKSTVNAIYCEGNIILPNETLQLYDSYLDLLASNGIPRQSVNY